MDQQVSKFLNQKNNSLTNNKSKFKNLIISFFNKILVCFIIGLTCLIFLKTNPSFKEFITNKVFKDNLSFAYFNNLYNKYFGSIFPSYVNNDSETVFNEKLSYKSSSSYYDGYKLEVDNKYLVPIINSGIVVFIGEIENYGKTVIIEGIDGVDIWYGNLDNYGVKIYDYVKEGNYLGEVKDTNLYLVFQKNREYLKIEDYLPKN